MSDDEEKPGAEPQTQPIGLQKRAIQIIVDNVCITVASDSDDLDRVKGIAVELVDKYKNMDDKRCCQ